MISDTVKLEHRVILDMVRHGSSVLDLGCGEGELLALLVRERNARVHGIELDNQFIYRCVAKGLSVFHGDIDSGLQEYADKVFDYIILNQSLQRVKKPDAVLGEALRVAREVIIAFPNFAHYRARLQIFFRGRTPVTPSLPYEWHDTPNLHFLSISDFVEYCRARRIQIKNTVFTGNAKVVILLPNLRSAVGTFLLARGNEGQA